MKELNLSFRGERDYLLAADLFVAVLASFSADYQPSEMHSTFFSKARHKVALCVFSPENLPFAHARYQDKEHDLLLMPLPALPGQRIQDREEELHRYFAVADREIRITAPTSMTFSPVHQAVAGFKYLLRQPLHLGAAAQFVVARLYLKRLFSGPFTLAYTRIMGGSFHEGDIRQNNQSLGKIYFARELS